MTPSHAVAVIFLAVALSLPSHGAGTGGDDVGGGVVIGGGTGRDAPPYVWLFGVADEGEMAVWQQICSDMDLECDVHASYSDHTTDDPRVLVFTSSDISEIGDVEHLLENPTPVIVTNPEAANAIGLCSEVFVTSNSSELRVGNPVSSLSAFMTQNVSLGVPPSMAYCEGASNSEFVMGAYKVGTPEDLVLVGHTRDMVMYSGEIAAGNRVFWGGIHAYSNADANYNMMRSTLMWASRFMYVATPAIVRVGNVFAVSIEIRNFDGSILAINEGTAVLIEIVNPGGFNAVLSGAVSGTTTPSTQKASLSVSVDSFVRGAAIRAICTEELQNCVDAVSAPFDVLEDPPVVSAITPPSAPIGGGTVVEIIGTNLGTNQSDVLAVSMGGTPCASFLWVSPSRINCTVAAVVSRMAVSVRVETYRGGTESGTVTFNYADPSITTVTPTEGPVSGGNTLVMTGVDLGFLTADVLGVTIGGVACHSLGTSGLPTTLTCMPPSSGLEVGSASLVVSTVNGDATTSYQVLPPPSISDIFPPVFNASGTRVTITGTDLGTDASDVVIVAVGNNQCVLDPVASAFNTELICDAPAMTNGFTAFVAVVTVRGGIGIAPEQFVVASLPALIAVNPAAGPFSGGQTVVVEGDDLGLFPGDTTVLIDGLPCNVIDWGGLPDNVTCVTPGANSGGPGPVSVEVSTLSGGTPETVGIEEEPAYLYGAVPSVANIVPAVGPSVGGVTVTITGTALGLSQADVEYITIGGSPCSFNGTSTRLPNTITCRTSPMAIGPVDIAYATTSGGPAIFSGLYTVNDSVPYTTAVSPNSGPTGGGQPITLTGYFPGAAVSSVTINGSACNGAVLAGPTEVTCTTTSSAASGAFLPVVTIDGVAGYASARYTYSGIPFVTAVMPPAIPPSEPGIRITLSGSDLGADPSDVESVTVGGAACQLDAESGDLLPSVLTCVAPPLGAGSFDVLVNTTSGGAGLPGAAQVVYAAIPFVTGIAPTLGPAAGAPSAPLRLTGFNMGAANLVSIGGTPVAVLDASDPKNISVTNPGGPVSSSNPVGIQASGGDTSGYVAPDVVFTWVEAPAATSVEPTKGKETAPMAVTITGERLGLGPSDVVSVTVGASACTDVVWHTSTRLTCNTNGNGGESGAVPVVVETVSGGAGTGPATFAFVGNPKIESVEPTQVPLWGGFNLTITGTDFGYEASDIDLLRVASVPCANFVVEGSPITAIYCTATPPTFSSTAFGIDLSTIFGASLDALPAVFDCATAPNVSTCAACQATHASCGWCDGQGACGQGGDCTDLLQTCPTVTAVSPPSASENGGGLVTVTGTGFVDRASGLSCMFGDREADSVNVINNTHVVFESPQQFAAGLVFLRLVRSNDVDYDPDGLLDFTYYDCASAVTCDACAATGSVCEWCPASHTCGDPGDCAAGIPSDAALVNGSCPSLESVDVSSSPYFGNYPVRINGSGIVQPQTAGRIRCHFANEESVATVVSDTQLLCKSPPLQPGDPMPPTMLTVQYETFTFAASPVFAFSFYECGTATSCGACATTGPECVWCAETGGGAGRCQASLALCDGGDEVRPFSACDGDGGSSAAFETNESAASVVPIVAGSAGLVVAIVAGVVVWCLCCRSKSDYVDDDDGATVRASDNALGTKVKAAMRKNSKRIGGGANSVVYKVKMDRETVCLKVITQDGRAARLEYQREVAALSRLVTQDHPAIVELKFFVKDDPICIAMEYCAGGDLKTYIRTKGSKLGAAAQTRLAFQIASGMAVVHGLGIAHLDLKTANILLDKAANAKICDFGISQLVTEEGYSVASSQDGFAIDRYETIDTMPPSGSATTNGSLEEPELAFTPQYVDPQRLAEDVGKIPTNLKTCDVFSFSLLVWAMASHAEPHADREPEAIVQRYRLDPGFRLDLPEDGDEALTEIIEECWDPRPAERPSFETLASRLGNILEVVHGTPLDRDYVRDLDTDRTIAYKTVNPVFEAGDSGGGSSSGALLLGDTAFDSVVHLPPPPPPVETDVMTMVPPPPPPDGSTLMTMVPPPPPPDGSTLMTMVPPPPPPDSSTLMTMVPPPPPPEAGDGVEMSTFSG